MKSFDEIYEEISEKYNKKYKEIFGEVDENIIEEIKKDEEKKKRIFDNPLLTSVLITVVIVIVIFIIAGMEILWENLPTDLTENLKIIFNVIFLIALIILLIYIKNKSKDIKSYRLREKRALYKESIVNSLIKNYSDKLNYYANIGISFSEYRASGFDYYDVFHSEDLIKGTILNNCFIEMADIQIDEKSKDSDGMTRYITHFRGLFAKITLNQNQSTSFKILKNQSKNEKSKDKSKIYMDSSEFEKVYDVFTEDKISTFRILTSDIMQMFTDFKNKHYATPEISLIDNNLYIRIDVGNVFEAKRLAILDKKSIEETYNLINFVFEFIEAFSNNILEFEK